MKKKILITGGAGFIGSSLADHLLARGDTVLVIDNFLTGRRENLAPHANLELIEGSITDATLLENCFARFKPDTVIHCAASYNDPNAWETDIQTNVYGTVNVVRASLAHAVKRLIYFQTSLCYGLHPKEQPVTLNYPLNPQGSSYAYSKTAAEQYITLSGIPHITFRLANMYGPRNISGPLPTFYQRLSTGRPCFVMDTRRDFVFISDLVAVVVQAVDGAGQNGVYHIASGKDFSISELFETTVSAMQIKLDKPVETRPRSADDAPTILLDPSKTKRDFGDWEVRVSLAEGVQKAVAWYQAHPISQTYTHLKKE